jgi:hypothetical protein
MPWTTHADFLDLTVAAQSPVIVLGFAKRVKCKPQDFVGDSDGPCHLAAVLGWFLV